MNSGGLSAAVEYIGESSGNACLPAVMILGYDDSIYYPLFHYNQICDNNRYVGAHSESLGMAVIASKVTSSTLYDAVFILNYSYRTGCCSTCYITS